MEAKSSSWKTISRSSNRIPLILLFLIIVMLPFMVCNLYYGFNENVCLDEKIQNFMILFPVTVWLIVQGFFDLVSILIYGGYAIAILLKPLSQRSMRWLFAYFLFATVFRFAWFIVGACMYWGYLWASNLCLPGVDAYMFIMLILSMLIQTLVQVYFLYVFWAAMQRYSGQQTNTQVKAPETAYELKVQEPRPYDNEHQTYYNATIDGMATPPAWAPQTYQNGYYQQGIQVQQPYAAPPVENYPIPIQEPHPYPSGSQVRYPPLPPLPPFQQGVQQLPQAGYLYGSQINRYQ